MMKLFYFLLYNLSAYIKGRADLNNLTRQLEDNASMCLSTMSARLTIIIHENMIK